MVNWGWGGWGIATFSFTIRTAWGQQELPRLSNGFDRAEWKGQKTAPAPVGRNQGKEELRVWSIQTCRQFHITRSRGNYGCKWHRGHRGLYSVPFPIRWLREGTIGRIKLIFLIPLSDSHMFFFLPSSDLSGSSSVSKWFHTCFPSFFQSVFPLCNWPP